MNLRRLSWQVCLASVVACACSKSVAERVDQPDSVEILPGFQCELVYRVPQHQGSWVSLTCDPQGRLIASDQYGKLYRISPGLRGGAPTVEQLDINIGRAHGLLCAFDSLYVVAHAGDGRPSGLYRAQDTDGDDRYDQVRLLRELDGDGEHGPHAVILGPDGQALYVCGGNHTAIPDPEASRVPRNWQEDQVLPRMWDAGGHAVGITAPGGWICRTDPAGKQFELISVGFRNQYDIAFDAAGELFTYDADMEWDIGTPWYRPTRVCHVTSGSEFGWRSGTGKWPSYYQDSLPATLDIGPGSPTGISFGSRARFPARYQRALFIADWSYGIIYAVHLQSHGASYTATHERFCAAPALPVADLVINPADGAMYFVVGGRRVQSAMYRIHYVGQESTDPIAAPPPNELQQLRRAIEAAHTQPAATPLDELWRHLSHPDRFIRYAARVAIEHQPVDQWQQRALEETHPQARLEAITALARCAPASQQAAAIRALGQLPWSELSVEQRLQLLRAYGLILARMGDAPQEIAAAINDHLAEHYPANHPTLDRELSRLLVATSAPEVVPRTMQRLAQAPTQEEQIHYVLCLRVAQDGWTDALRRDYFQWFIDAARLQGGNSFDGFLANIRQEAIDRLDEKVRTELQELLDIAPSPTDPYAELKARPLVKKWTVDELLQAATADHAGHDLENGKRMFALAQCYKCHRIAGEGGYVGPDLTPAGQRLELKDMLVTLIDPNYEVSDQYRATTFQLTDGRTISGRVINLNGNTYMVQTDMINPGRLTNISRDQIEQMRPSTTSMMPEGLLDNLTQDEILDLLAYLRSGGQTDSPPAGN